MDVRVGRYRVRASGQVAFPLLVLGFSVAYALQVRGLSAESLLFAKPLLYVSVVLSLYLTVREGVCVERVSGEGKMGDARGERLRVMKAVAAENGRMLILATSIFVYVLCLEYVGFLVLSILFLVVTMLLFGVRGRFVLVTVPVTIVASLYLLLGWWLRLPLPEGMMLTLFTK